MKAIEFNGETTIQPPNDDGEVEIKFEDDYGIVVKYVSFEELERWVASIREQIIPNATDIHIPIHENGLIGCGGSCKKCGGNSLSCGCR